MMSKYFWTAMLQPSVSSVIAATFVFRAKMLDGIFDDRFCVCNEMYRNLDELLCFHSYMARFQIRHICGCELPSLPSLHWGILSALPKQIIARGNPRLHLPDCKWEIKWVLSTLAVQQDGQNCQSKYTKKAWVIEKREEPNKIFEEPNEHLQVQKCILGPSPLLIGDEVTVCHFNGEDRLL